MSDINCPYCDTEQEINHDDGYGYEEGVKHTQECWKCEKTFVFETCISISYDASKADCLNDGNHDFKSTHTFPKEFTEMKCSMCDEKRKPTEKEMNEIMK